MNIDNKDWLIRDRVVIRYKGNATEVIVPDGVKEIGDSAFEFKKIDKVHLPEGLLKIGKNAFKNNLLTTINFPSTLTSIGEGAFLNNYLKRLNLPNSVTIVGNDAFRNNQLKEINLSTNMTGIWNATFANNNITTLSIPDNIKVICKYGFCGNKIKEIVLPKTLNSVYDNAFDSAELKKIIILNPEINLSHSFVNCLLETIVIPTINDNTFDILVELKKYHRLDTVKEIIVNDTKLDLSVKITFRTIIPLHIKIKYEEYKPDATIKVDKSILNKEIQDLIDKINKLIIDFDKDRQQLIKNRVESLINNYHNQYMKLKPKLNLEEDDNILSLNNNSCELEQTKLIMELTKIITLLNNKGMYTNLSKEIEEYKKIINSNIDKQPKDVKDISNIIRYIVCVSQLFNDVNINKKLVTIIQDISDKIENYLNKDFNLNLDGDLQTKLYTQITSLYVEAYNNYNKELLIYNKIKNIIEQLNNSITILQNNNITPIGSIDSTILDIVTSIDNLDNSDKINIYNKLEQILNSWIIRLQNEKMLVVNDWNNDINIQDDSLKIQIMILKDIYSIDYKVKKYIKQKQLYSSHKL